MPKIQAGVAGTNFFNLNGLDYGKNQYQVVYSDVEAASDGNPDLTKVNVGLQLKYTQRYIQHPTLFSNWTNDSDVPYASVTALLTDLETLVGFNTASGGSGATLFEKSTDGQPAVFADAAARDTYFTANPGDLALVDNDPCALIRLDDDGAGQIAYQQRVSSAWRDATKIVRGPAGPTGEFEPSNFVYASNETELIAAMEATQPTVSNIIILTNRIALTNNTVNLQGDVVIIGFGTVGDFYGELFLTNSNSWTINGRLVHLYCNVIGDINNNSDSFTFNSVNGTVVYARRIVFISTVTLDDLEMRYEFAGSNVSFNTVNGGNDIQEYWDNTNRTAPLREVAALASDGVFQAEVNTSISFALLGTDGIIDMPQNADTGAIVKLNQLNSIGSNTLTFRDTVNSFVFQRRDGTQVTDTEVVLNGSFQVEFSWDGGTWRFYDNF